MQPAELKAASFSGYPPQARTLAIQQLPVLRDLPLVLLPILLRELITFDWKLPAERRDLQAQFTSLSAMSAAERTSALRDLRLLTLNESLAQLDWVNNPSAFMEQLTAWLWSTHQMDRFRAIADTYTATVNNKLPPPPPSMPRLGIVLIGGGTADTTQPLFRKLRPHGVHLTHLIPADGLPMLLEQASRRAALSRTPPHDASTDPTLLHWYIDGGTPPRQPALTQVSYEALDKPRSLLLNHIQQAIGSGGMGPEELRSLLARMKPSDVGLPDTGKDAILNHFQLSLLTEGAGTQIFATTFVQWAARECVRRAQPETLIVRYTPRQQAQTMNTMLSGAKPTGTDPAGSLIDADMGAFYTWLNLRRLTGADQLRFLVWFEGHREALAIGPGLPQGTSSDSPLNLHQVLDLLA